jgi:hypothetical protein
MRKGRSRPKGVATHRLVLLVLFALTALVADVSGAPSARAYERHAELERVVARFALREAEVRCPSADEWVADPIWGPDPRVPRGWAYTNMVRDYVVLHPLLCAGALHVTDPEVSMAERAAAALVLLHEAYHVRRWSGRWSEGRVECQAIRNFKAAARALGASPTLANELLPYALALHLRMGARFPEYADRRCRLPVWAPPFAP